MSVQRIFDIRNVNSLEDICRELPTFFEGFESDDAEAFLKKLQAINFKLDQSWEYLRSRELSALESLREEQNENSDLRRQIRELTESKDGTYPPA